MELLMPGWLPFLIYYVYWMAKRKPLKRQRERYFAFARKRLVIDRRTLDCMWQPAEAV